MSAFVVSNTTMGRVVNRLFAASHDQRCTWSKPPAELWAKTVEALPELGQLLYSLNARAVSERYGEPAQEVQYVHHWTINSSPVQDLKSLHCLIYQCSEGNVPDTDLYKALVQYSHKLAEDIVRQLPEYNKAVWD